MTDKNKEIVLEQYPDAALVIFEGGFICKIVSGTTDLSTVHILQSDAWQDAANRIKLKEHG